MTEFHTTVRLPRHGEVRPGPDVPPRTGDGRITREECMNMFGGRMPVEAASLLIASGSGLDVARVRARLREMADGWNSASPERGMPAGKALPWTRPWTPAGTLPARAGSPGDACAPSSQPPGCRCDLHEHSRDGHPDRDRPQGGLP